MPKLERSFPSRSFIFLAKVVHGGAKRREEVSKGGIPGVIGKENDGGRT